MSFATRPEQAPIHDLQTMLRTVVPQRGLGLDGIYGRETQAAVREFQRTQGLTESGVADAETWNSLVQAFKKAEVLRAPAEPLQIVLQPFQVITLDERNLHIYLVQGMLSALGNIYFELPPLDLTGVLDAPTAQGLRLIQKSAGLKETGELDKETWRNLAQQYRSAVGDGTGRIPIRKVQQSSENRAQT